METIYTKIKKFNPTPRKMTLKDKRIQTVLEAGLRTVHAQNAALMVEKYELETLMESSTNVNECMILKEELNKVSNKINDLVVPRRELEECLSDYPITKKPMDGNCMMCGAPTLYGKWMVTM